MAKQHTVVSKSAVNCQPLSRFPTPQFIVIIAKMSSWNLQVQWTEHPTAGDKAPPTCVLVHGILGSRKNMISFAHRIVEACLSPSKHLNLPVTT